jgi:predicted RNA-binding Zn ribbon-like protein
MANGWTFCIGKDGKIQSIDKNVKPATSAEDMIAKLHELGVSTRSLLWKDWDQKNPLLGCNSQSARCGLAHSQSQKLQHCRHRCTGLLRTSRRNALRTGSSSARNAMAGPGWLSATPEQQPM